LWGARRHWRSRARLSSEVVPDVIRDQILASMPLARMGEVGVMVNACLFLLSEKASWITVQILAVDGGPILRA
jgi:NAD(P)-dependent dehydrogenase (short-subunit alcohol dehydrogenase family)